MKKSFFVLFTVVFCLCIVGCEQKEIGQYVETQKIEIANINALECVRLPDYKNLTISKDDIEISKVDIENIMSWDFASTEAFIEINSRTRICEEDVILLNILFEDSNSEELYYEVGEKDIFDSETVFINHKVGEKINSKLIADGGNFDVLVEIIGIYRYPEVTDIDFILDYYHCKTMSDVENLIRKRACNEISYYHMWEYIQDGAEIIYYPDIIEMEITEAVEQIKNDSQAMGITIEEYLMMNDTTYSEYVQFLYDYYGEFLIKKAILENERVVVGESALNDIIYEVCNDLKIERGEVYKYYTEEDLYYKAVKKLAKEQLILLIQIID